MGRFILCGGGGGGGGMNDIMFVLCYTVLCSSQWNVRWAVASFGLLSFSCAFMFIIWLRE